MGGLSRSIVERGAKGVYQPCSEKDLYRYTVELSYRHSNPSVYGIGDAERDTIALRSALEKPVTYEMTHQVMQAKR
ncbi:hypothetical protein SAMN04488094_11954 [Tropicimonas isoalkanivorans]|uniref:Uncharacterized protein n=1 Tax=Tropicimonas isoalkanivorans TaxID=441112 RepID=A0A1I1QMR9_9RHOB|nr:hypothetical protein SAMN04488094_11954 [Tropicimonas isoalkanivorans]